MNEDFPYRQTPPPSQAPQGHSAKAIVSMVLGIVFIPLCCLCFVALPASIVGLVLGILSRKNNEPGGGMAIAGIVLCSIAIALSAFCLITDIFFATQMPDFMLLFEDFFDAL